MPVDFFPLLNGVAALLMFGSAFYLLIHARSVAALFNRRDNEIAPGPGRRPPPRNRILTALILFVISSALTATVITSYITGGANKVTEGNPEQVDRP